MKLISFDIKSDFGFLKKPDINEGEIFITYNMLHKPALLGVLGAIVGLRGYVKYGVLPEYYEQLINIRVGIMPLNDENGRYQKTNIKYNNSIGFGNLDKTNKFGETINITEQTLIKPAFRCYLELDDTIEIQNKLIHNILNRKSEYLPYLGKNEHSIWWENPFEIEYKEYVNNYSFNIITIFTKTISIKEQIEEEEFDIFSMNDSDSIFMYFERLPIGFIKLGTYIYQYDLRSFVYTNRKLKGEAKIDNLCQLKSGEIIQLF